MIDGGWIGNQIYWSLKEHVTTNNYDSLTELHSEDHCNYSTQKVFPGFTSRCLVAAFTGGRSPSSGFPNSPWPRLRASLVSQPQLFNWLNNWLTAKQLLAHASTVILDSFPRGSLPYFTLWRNERLANTPETLLITDISYHGLQECFNTTERITELYKEHSTTQKIHFNIIHPPTSWSS
jgi:hypothetical protein